MNTRLTALLIAGTIAIASLRAADGLAQEDPASKEPLTPRQMRQDLVVLRQTMARDPSFSPDERERFNAIVDEASAKAETLTPATFALEVARAVAVSGNAHTNAEPIGFVRQLPIRVW